MRQYTDAELLALIPVARDPKGWDFLPASTMRPVEPLPWDDLDDDAGDDHG